MKGRIGVFDSGQGGRYTLQHIVQLLPDYSYLFFGDTAHMPYGERSPNEIQSLTFQALHYLFGQGCELVVLACNTASAYSIRERHRLYPHQKVLSVTIPGIQKLVALSPASCLVLSTQATEQSGIIMNLALQYGYHGKLTIQSCPGLADRIEQDSRVPFSKEEKKNIIADYVGDHSDYESILLACTHYGIWYDVFVDLYPEMSIIDPSQESASQLCDYLFRHPEIESKLALGGGIEEYWTKNW